MTPITFKTTSVAQMFIALVALKALGYKADGCNSDDNKYMAEDWFKNHPMLSVYRDNTFGGSYGTVGSESTVEAFIAKVAGLGKKTTVKLNAEYTAEITDAGLDIGGEKITFAKFDELVKAVAKVRQ